MRFATYGKLSFGALALLLSGCDAVQMQDKPPVVLATVDTSATPSPATIVPTMMNCPVFYQIYFTDYQSPYYTDTTDSVYNLVAPDRVDNAGFYRANGWDRLPTISPDDTSLANKDYSIGNHYLNFTLLDQYGNAQYCMIHILIVDNEDPEYSVCDPTSAQLNLGTDADRCAATLAWAEPVAADNDMQALTPVQITSITNGGSQAPGTYPVSYTATDQSGNVEYCDFTIAVEDTTDPWFDTCESDDGFYFAHECGPVGAEAGIQVDWTCGASDHCDTDVEVVCDEWIEITGPKSFHPDRSATLGSATCYEVGGITPDTACDGYKYCIIETQVIAGETKECALGVDFLTNEEWLMTRMDGATVYISGASGDQFPVPPQAKDGDITSFKVSCLATDDATNTKSTDFTFQIRDQRANPTFDYCPDYTRIVLNNSLMTSDPLFIPPTVQTNCDYNVTEASGKNENSSLGLGVHLFQYTAEDVHGNKGYCNFQVEVDFRDFVWVNFPKQNKTMIKYTDPVLGIYKNVNWSVPSIMNPYVEIVAPPILNGMAFPIGKTLVNYTANFVPPENNSLVQTGEKLDWTALLDMSSEMKEAVHAVQKAQSHPVDDPVTISPTSAPTLETYDFTDADGVQKTVIISELGMVLQFLVDVRDIERPTFQGGFNDRRQCEGSEVGVAEHEQCGGKRIVYSTLPGDDLTLYFDSVEDVSLNCCGSEYTCKDFSPYVQTCQK